MKRPASRIALVVLTVLCVAAGLLATRHRAAAGGLTLKVDTTDENVALQTCDDNGLFDCSLAGAITKTNATPGKDRIIFNVGGGDVMTLPITVQLPDITDALEIDGTTQPRVTAATLCIDDFDRPCIHLQGPGPSNLVAGLITTAPDVTIKGLSITDFSTGIFSISSDVLIARNFIGTADGVTAGPNNSGILTGNGDAVNVTIGGPTPEDRNVISGNLQEGLYLGRVDGAVVQGNYIGTDKSGLLALPNDVGIGADISVGGVTIGGDSPAERNVISGNVSIGVELIDQGFPGAGTTNFTVSGNYIGVDATGAAALPNHVGVSLLRGHATIGGDSSGERNVISGNNGSGVLVRDTSAGTTVEGNYVGLNAAGDAALGNAAAGIQVSSLESVTNGGVVRNNVASGNSVGVTFAVGTGGHIDGGRMYGNIIGLNAAADAKIPNAFVGVYVHDDGGGIVTNVMIDAGPNGDSPNIISGNATEGVTINNTGVSEIVVSSNFIGTNQDLAPGLGNGGSGVLVSGSADNLIVANVVRNNEGWGVTFDDPGAVRNTVSENTIDNNTQLGIFSDDGAQPNAIAPVLTAAESGSTYVTGTLASAASTEYLIEFFRSPSCDPSGFGEGRTFIGSDEVDTDTSGDATFSALFQPTSPVGEVITATATGPDGSTSQFSNCVTVTAATPGPTPSPSPSGSTTPTPTGTAELLGDADCDGNVDLDDAIAALSEFAVVEPGAACEAEADVDCDDDVDAMDALRIAAYVAGVPLLPLAGCGPIGP